MRILVLTFSLASLAAQAGHAQSTPTFQGRGEVGIEYDSNPSRLERVAGAPPPSIEAASATRLNGNGASTYAVSERMTVAFSGGGALRVFLPEEARHETMAILMGTGAVNLRVAQAMALSLSLGYYDAFQARVPTARDFRSVSPGVQAERQMGPGVVGLGAGYRWFAFKPFSAFDFAGPRATASYRILSLSDLEVDPDGADWELLAHASIEHRQFGGARCVENDICPPAIPVGRRVDDFVFAGVEVTRTKDQLLGAGLAGQWNQSNSFGDSLFRLAVHAKGALMLPFRVLLSARAEILLSRYAVALPLVRDEVTGLVRASIEDESRSTLRCELSRTLWSGVDLFARYVFYSNELGRGPAFYRRQTMLLSLSFVFEP